MAIQPAGRILICAGIPIDMTYNDTLTFANSNAQFSYFKTKAKYDFDELQYVRENVVRVKKQAPSLVDCNYIAFQNKPYKDKWFYAFITDIVYLNDAVTEIRFELDVIQTFYFEIQWCECYVEREHVTNDDKWTHYTPEPYPLGECIFTQQKYLTSGGIDYIVYSNYDLSHVEEKRKVLSSKVNGTVYPCLLYLCRSYGDVVGVVENLQAIADNSVIAVQTISKSLTSELVTNVNKIIETEVYTTYAGGQLKFDVSKFGNYTPRNNKCFNYPYFALYVTNEQGNNAEYSFEHTTSKNGTIGITIYGDTSLNSGTIFHLNEYKNTSNHDFDLPLCSYPQAPFSSTNYIQYNNEQLQMRVGGSIQAARSTVSQDWVGSINALTDTVLNGLALQATQDNTPPTIHNLTGYSDLSIKAGSGGFYRGKVMIRRLKESQAKRLDEFFDRFGYQVNTLKKPNITGRPNWNYVKTKGAIIKGNINREYAEKIQSALDNGVTFWHNPANVGNYSLNNK